MTKQQNNGILDQTFCDCTSIHEEKVEVVRKKMATEDEFYNLSNLYKMFSDNTRLKILYALDSEELCVCDLAVLLNMTKSAISHQLKLLRLSNLVKFRKEGKISYYSLVDSHVCDILKQGFLHINE